MNTTASINHQQTKAHHHPIKLMGCGFVITAIDDDPQRAWDAIRAGVKEIERIEDLISSWKDDSETTKINKHAGIAPVEISKELFELIRRSLKISTITSGAFDISGTLSRYYWQFDRQEHACLEKEKIHELRDLINYQLIELDEERSAVFLRKKGMKIGFGGIGKGYAAHRAQVVMKAFGIESGLINASGDLMCWGNALHKKNWTINIPHPNNRTEPLMEFDIPYGSIVSSGNHENYTLINGKRYSHIVDPRTGLPVKLIKNVSVISPNPEFADAMATAITVMGPDAGIQLVNRLNGVECIVIDEDDNIYYSNHLNPNELC